MLIIIALYLHQKSKNNSHEKEQIIHLNLVSLTDHTPPFLSTTASTRLLNLVRFSTCLAFVLIEEILILYLLLFPQVEASLARTDLPPSTLTT